MAIRRRRNARMQHFSRSSSRVYQPSPLSTVTNTKDIDDIAAKEEAEEENPLDDLERAVGRADSPLQTSPPPSPKISTSQSSSLPPSIPSTPPRIAAARRARSQKFLFLKQKSYIHELTLRNRTLRGKTYAALKGNGTLPVALVTGDLTLPPGCTLEGCELHSEGWAPELVLAWQGADLLGRRIKRLAGEEEGLAVELLREQRALQEEEVRVLWGMHLDLEELF